MHAMLPETEEIWWLKRKYKSIVCSQLIASGLELESMPTNNLPVHRLWRGQNTVVQAQISVPQILENNKQTGCGPWHHACCPTKRSSHKSNAESETMSGEQWDGVNSETTNGKGRRLGELQLFKCQKNSQRG